jgi:hypothetical protein
VNGSEQGQPGSANEKPHILRAFFGTYGAVRWTVECPYEGVAECGLMEPCTEHHEPGSPTGPEHRDRAAWRRWDLLHEEWAQDHPSGPHHPGSKCWYEYSLEEGDWEPEYYLAEIPDGTPVMQAMRVQVGYEGYDDECEPRFKLWKD